MSTMQSQAQTVNDYLETVPGERKAALEKLRACCQSILTSYNESISYKMPTYTRDGEMAIAFASQKNYIALYVMKKDVVDKYRAELPSVGKGCIRYSKPEKMDFDVIEKLLKDTVASSTSPC